MEKMRKLFYFDNNATTPIDNRVLEAMMPFFTNQYANASSTHQAGLDSKIAVNKARLKVANLIGSDIKEIVFTSGATESINLALQGLALSSDNKKKHLITCKTEHKAVLEACSYLESIGFEIDYLPVNDNGELDLQLLKKTIRQDTLLVCIMWVNNETGVIHPIKKIGQIAKEAGVYYICDATQGIGKLPIDVIDDNIDILCFSGHKVYAPKGIGGIYLKKEIANLKPLIYGGGQENGVRGGTYNVPLIVGIGTAFEIAEKEMNSNKLLIGNLQHYLENELNKIEDGCINAKRATRIFNTSNFSLPNFDVDVFIGLNRDISLSNGSACNAALIQPSHVLLAMGLSNDKAMNSLRISLGKENSITDIEFLINRIRNFLGI